MIKRSTRRRPSTLLLASGAASVLLGAHQSAMAGATVAFGDGESISVGFGLRDSFSSTSKSAPNGSNDGNNFTLEDVRLYTSATLNPYVKATFNVVRGSDNKVQVLDAYAQFELDPVFNIWAGRVLPPGDRENMDGPYYQLAYDYPGVVSNFYSVEDGRDDGVAFWGKVADKKLVYALGAFQGRNHTGAVANTSNQSGNVLYSARVAYNFLNPEPAPGYLTGSTYFGTAGDIFTLAAAGMTQSDGVGSSAVRSDYQVWDLDALLELPSADGTFDASAAFYHYGYRYAAYTADASSDAGISMPGTAYLAQVGYLIAQKVGPGQFQPFARWQHMSYDASQGSQSKVDVGTHYVLKGADARLSLFYVRDEYSGALGNSHPNTNTIKVALQLQY